MLHLLIGLILVQPLILSTEQIYDATLEELGGELKVVSTLKQVTQGTNYNIPSDTTSFYTTTAASTGDTNELDPSTEPTPVPPNSGTLVMILILTAVLFTIFVFVLLIVFLRRRNQ